VSEAHEPACSYWRDNGRRNRSNWAGLAVPAAACSRWRDNGRRSRSNWAGLAVPAAACSSWRDNRAATPWLRYFTGMVDVAIEPRGRFSLTAAQRFLGGFTPAAGTFTDDATRLTMAFPVDGWAGSAVAVVWQDGAVIRGEAVVSAPEVTVEAVRGQVARTLSLDHDGAGWDDVGRRDPVVGRLQAEFDHVRPVCFYSPYEAAVQAIIGQRISMRQAARIKTALAVAHGERLEVGGQQLHAFALPQQLLDVDEAPGLNAEKLSRLHAVAQAAIDGRLDAALLRALPVDEALASLREIRGIGEWSSQHVLLRGAGVADAVPLADPRTRVAVRAAYDLPAEPDDAELTAISDVWRPFRMWGFVLVRLWHGRTAGGTLRQ
jgi:DNA-3-methyladenine glycosylase II